MKTFFALSTMVLIFCSGCGSPNYGINGGGPSTLSAASVKKNATRVPMASGIDGMSCMASQAKNSAGVVVEVNAVCHQLDNTKFISTVCSVSWSIDHNVVNVTRETYAGTVTIPSVTAPTKTENYWGSVPGESIEAAQTYINTVFPTDCQKPEHNLKLSVPPADSTAQPANSIQ